MTTLEFYYSEKQRQYVLSERECGSTVTIYAFGGSYKILAHKCDSFFKGQLYTSAAPLGVSPGNWDDFVHLGQGDSPKDVEHRPV